MQNEADIEWLAQAHGGRPITVDMPWAMNINLKLLQSFLLVADTRSFRKAAEESNRTPSALTAQIKQLETQLGVPLFTRTTRSVSLTPEGRHLLDKARQALAMVSEGLDEIRDAAEMRRAAVSLASSPTITATMLPAILLNFQKEQPRITVRVRELLLPDLLESIRRQEVDFGVSWPGQGMGDFHFEPLVRDPVCVIMLPDHPLAKRRRITIDDLANHALVLFSGTGAATLRRQIDDAAEARNIRLSVCYEVQQPPTVAAFVAMGLGIGLIPRVAVPPAEAFRLRIAPLSEPALVRELGLITVKGKAMSAPAAALAEQIRRTLRPNSTEKN